MTYSSNDLNRLSLHDSTLESTTRRGTSLALVFDWAKLIHLAEENIAESIILGQTTLTLVGIEREVFEVYKDETGSLHAISPAEGLSKLELIIDNKLLNPNNLAITGLFTEAAGSNWVEWRSTFTTCTIGWNTFITQAEWLAGKLPPA